MSSLLCICEQGYRASVEEQDDTVVWMAHMLQRCEGTDVSLVLKGSAVNYAFDGQKSVGVEFGDWKQAHPADFPRDLSRFQADGGRIFALAADVERFGLSKDNLIDGVQTIDDVTNLAAEHDFVSFW